MTGARRNFGRFAILSEIATGRSGTVYCASDSDCGRILALKIIYLDENVTTLPDQTGQQLSKLASLNHPNIPALLEFGVLDRKLYLASALIDGHPLSRLLHDHAPIPPGRAVAIASAVASALKAAADAGVSHGTLTSEDILVTASDQVFVTGFGTSSFAEAGPGNAPAEGLQTADSEFADVRMVAVLLKRMLAGQKLPENLNSLFRIADRERGSVASVRDAASLYAALDAVSAGLSSTRARNQIEKADPPAWLAPGLATAVILAGSALAGWHLLQNAPERHEGMDQLTRPLSEVTQSATIAAGSPPPVASSGLPTSAPAEGGASNNTAPPIPAHKPEVPGQQDTAAVAPPGDMASGAEAENGAPEGTAGSTDATTGKTADAEPDDRVAEFAPLPETPAANLVSLVPCGVLAIDDGAEDFIKISGLVASPNALSEAAANLPQTLSGQSVALELAEAPAQFCDVLTILADGRKRDASMLRPMAITLQAEGGEFKGGQDLVFDLHGPEDAIHLQIDYFATDGSVIHLLPNPLEPNGTMGAASIRRLGERRMDSRHWTIAPPFGIELIIAIATQKPLFSSPRPEAEPAVTYLTDLRQALAAAEAADESGKARSPLEKPRVAVQFIHTSAPPAQPVSSAADASVPAPAPP